MTPVWLMSALEIHTDMARAAKSKSKEIHVETLLVEEGPFAGDDDLPLWAHILLEHSWDEEA